MTKSLDKYDISEAIHAVRSKLEHCASTKETTADEMVRDFWAVVEQFPIPAPPKPSAYAQAQAELMLLGIPPA